MNAVKVDVAVIGGGMAGICAALAAARQGCQVALITDRPVLGGNASSEVRVWVMGAMGGRNIRYGREGGIIEELLLENRWYNQDGNAHVWDTVMLDVVRKESTLQLFLNTLVYDVEMAPGPDRRIGAVFGRQNATEKLFRFEASQFIDASGDGAAAAAAGADWVMGREGRDVYGESWAPEQGDALTLGSSLMFNTRDAGYPVTFRPPSFAKDFRGEHCPPIVKRADPKDTRCCWWWIEYGGVLDTIKDTEVIRDELMAMVYGVWDYIKNSGRFEGVENLQLEWVASVPGKRESRRFLGDYVLTEHDVVGQRQHPDRVAHGGWSIDLHPPKGFYDERGAGSHHWHTDGPYTIPYRCLYSRNVGNLLFAGRNISASHVAFGTTRVMATCATAGQAVGTAAALAVAHGTTPRGVYEQYLSDLQQQLLRDGQWVIGVAGQDPADLVRSRALRFSASSTRRLTMTTARGEARLSVDHYLRLPLSQRLDEVKLLVRAERDTVLQVELWRGERPENYLPKHFEAATEVTVPAGEHWVSVPCGGREPGADGGLYLWLKANPNLVLRTGDTKLTGVLFARLAGNRESGHEGSWSGDAFWPWVRDGLPCFVVSPEQAIHEPENVANGYARPYGGANCWLSEPGVPQWLQVDLAEPATVGRVELAFNSDPNRQYNNLVPTGHDAIPEIVKDCRVLARVDGQWVQVAEVSGNYQRLSRVTFAPVLADALRVEAQATWGWPAVEIYEVRAYAR